MSFNAMARSLFRNLFRSRHVERDLDQEIHSHLELLIDENMRAGMAPKEAQRMAWLELGSIDQVKDRVRERRIGNWLRSVVCDCRYALRQIRSNPGFTSVAVLTLALGVGANTTIFSFSDAILLRPIPVARPSEVLTVANTTPSNALQGLSYPDYIDIRAYNHSFSELLAYRSTTLGVGITSKAPPQMRSAMTVSNNFFSGLEVIPALGRTFLPGEGAVTGRDPVAVLGYDFWKSQFAGDPSVIGRPLRLNGEPFTIIGVAPESFPGIDRFFPPSVFIPLSMWGLLEGDQEDPLKDRSLHVLSVKGRLRPGLTPGAAQQELTIIGQRLERNYPKAGLQPQYRVAHGIPGPHPKGTCPAGTRGDFDDIGWPCSCYRVCQRSRPDAGASAISKPRDIRAHCARSGAASSDTTVNDGESDRGLARWNGRSSHGVRRHLPLEHHPNS